MRIRIPLILLLMAAAMLAVGCGDDDKKETDDMVDAEMDGDMIDGGDDMDAEDDGDTGDDMVDADDMDDADDTDDADDMDTGDDMDATMATTFEIRIENISPYADLPFAPGAWAVHDGSSEPLFTADMPDSGDGLEALAEDGMASTLATNAGGGVFNMAETGGEGPLAPGDAYVFTVEANDGDHLSMASMFIPSNDWFIATNEGGIALFDGNGDPISGNVSTDFALWDAGTERNQAPLQGLTQAPRQAAADTGSAEGVVGPWEDTTRALPHPSKLLDVSVSEAGGIFTVTVSNISRSGNAFVTPFAPVYWAVHDDTFQLFTPGSAAPTGLELLAEDGDPSDLVTATSVVSGVADAGAAAMPVGGGMPGPIGPGGSYEFSVTPDAANRHLSFATMVVQTNDLFVALPPSGVALLDANGNPRDTNDIEADISTHFWIWDAGTEINETPGVGPHQAPRQEATGEPGAVDPNTNVRRYDDLTNDLDSSNEALAGFATVTVTHGANAGEFDVVVENTSAAPRPGAITPIAWAVHDNTASLFTTGMPASPGLEALAEDGNPMVLDTELSNAGVGIGSHGVMAIPEGEGDAGPAFPGMRYEFTVTADSTHPYLSLASMVVPSNDTFLAFEPSGILLIDSNGDRRSENDIATDIASMLQAWDAGTEANQGGAHGPDMAGLGLQENPGDGDEEGNGNVRPIDDPVWAYPPAQVLWSVTVTPQ